MNTNSNTDNRQSGTDFAEARELQWVWKTPAMAAMAVAVCRLAIERAGQEFSAKDVKLPDHGGQGIAGAIFKRLADDEVLSPVGSFDGAAKFLPKYVTNEGGNPIRVWRLKSYARALRLIVLHGGSATSHLQFKQAALPGWH
jgi:hypothetical protein